MTWVVLRLTAALLYLNLEIAFYIPEAFILCGYLFRLSYQPMM